MLFIPSSMAVEQPKHMQVVLVRSNFTTQQTEHKRKAKTLRDHKPIPRLVHGCRRI